MRNQTSDLWILCLDTLPLSHGDSMVSIRPITKFSLLILHTVWISNINSIIMSFGFLLLFLMDSQHGKKKSQQQVFLLILRFSFII